MYGSWTEYAVLWKTSLVFIWDIFHFLKICKSWVWAQNRRRSKFYFWVDTFSKSGFFCLIINYTVISAKWILENLSQHCILSSTIIFYSRSVPLTDALYVGLTTVSLKALSYHEWIRYSMFSSLNLKGTVVIRIYHTLSMEGQ